MRGTKAAYDALTTKNADTLYFITDGENKTSLYLGETIVSSSANTLSPAAQDFLNNLPNSNDSALSDGDLQVYVIEETEVDKVDPETGEVIIDPETGEPEKEIKSEGHWETKSINDLIPTFEGGNAGLVPESTAGTQGKFLRGDGRWADLTTEILPQVIQSIVGDEPKLDEETGLPLYKQEDGTEGTTVTDKPIYTNGLSASFDTLVEISKWLENHSTDALDMQSRINALEEATGVNKTTTEERPKVDEEGNPVYIQKTQDDGGGGTEPLYWDGLTEDDKTIENTGYPVMIPNPDGDEPPYIQEVDDDNNPLYWNITDETPKTDNGNGNPAFVQATETIETEVPNDVEIIKAVVGNLNTLYPQVKAAQIGTLDDRINDLDSRFQAIETVLVGQDEQGIKIAPIGSLEALTKNLYTKDDQGNDTTSIVNALNLLDERMQWQNIPNQEQNP